MPKNWLHVLFDIITHGKYVEDNYYWYYHKWKDCPWKLLGRKHRRVRHDDYKKLMKKLEEKGIQLNISNPYDFLRYISLYDFKNVDVDNFDVIGLGHEVVDYVWSRLSNDQKIEWVKYFIDVIINPTKYFENGILEPDDLELIDFKNLNKYIKGKKEEELI